MLEGADADAEGWKGNGEMKTDKKEIIERLDIETFYTREFPSIKWNSSDWGQALCFKHDDTNPSLFVNRKTGQLHCKGCSYRASIFDYYMEKHGVDLQAALNALAKEAGVNQDSPKKIAATYDYTDESGNLLFQVVRYEPKDFIQRRPDGKGGWIWKMKGVRFVPYNLPELIKAEQVFVCEGEKDCLNLKAIGLTVTCNPMGAEKWRSEYNKHFTGKNVAIIPDNDKPGNAHALDVAKNLIKIANSVKVVSLPDLPDKGDVSDWIETKKASGIPDQQIKDDLIQIVEDSNPCNLPDLYKHERPEQMVIPDNKQLSQADKLIDLAHELKLFRDQHNEPFAYLNNESILLRSKKIKQWMSYRLYQEDGKAPNTEALNKALSVLEGRAIFDSPQVALHNRIALQGGNFWYDLGNGKAIKIDTEGWSIEKTFPILFRRYQHQQSQVIPLKDGEPWELFRFLNVDDDHHLLVLVYTISCFIPDIAHPIFHPHGAQGAGKTTLCRIIKKLCDPSTMETIITPRDVPQLVQILAHHHICLFDNMSALPSWMSDILAQACTGGGFSKRQLYTDDDDIIYQLKRCIGINGINLLISKPDLMDRSILLPLDRIHPSKRMDEAKFWEGFEKAKPSIIGAIFDAVSKAMAIYPTVELKELPRMADFVKWGYAIAAALGGHGDKFLRDYRQNVVRQNEEVIQGNTLAQAVLKLMDDQESWEGNIKEAWHKLKETADPDKNDASFPKSERSLRKHLEKIKTNLIDVGVTFHIGQRTSAGVPISFQKVGDSSSLTTHSNKFSNSKGLPDVDDLRMNVDDASLHTGSTSHNTLKNKENVDDVENVDQKQSAWHTDPNENASSDVVAVVGIAE